MSHIEARACPNAVIYQRRTQLGQSAQGQVYVVFNYLVFLGPVDVSDQSHRSIHWHAPNLEFHPHPDA
jgi:hypothetical protein